MATRAFELLDRRALAALVFVDSLGKRVMSPVAVYANGVRLFAKRPGELVVMSAPGLEAHGDAFEAPPAAPAIGSVAVQLDIVPADPRLGRRRFALALPRDPDPANMADAGSLFRPVEIALPPATGTLPTGLAAALAVSVRRTDNDRVVEGALVRLRPEGGRPEVAALTDAAGDAMLLVPAVPLASPGEGAVVRPDIAAALDAVIVPDLARFHPAEDVAAARDAATRRTSGLIDPDRVAASPGAIVAPEQEVRIAAGQTRTAAIAWSPP